MGTNFYAVTETAPACSHCKRGADIVRYHVGKSSAGWCFSLHVDEDLPDLDAWIALLDRPGITIEDEYGTVLNLAELLAIIRHRSRGAPPTGEMLQGNYALPGPNNLLRHRIDGRHCVGHGAGTWDLIVGSFS